MNWHRIIASWWYGIAAAAATFAFVLPLLTAPTDEVPTGNAGVFAPMVALFTAAIIFAEAVNGRALQPRRIPSFCIGIGSMASAYLWIAGEAGIHPANPTLLTPLLLLLAMGALVTVGVPLVALASKPQPDDQSSSEDDNH